MRGDLTDITIVLDRSGSMQAVAEQTISGFNRFLEDQKQADGEALLTLVQFDHEYEFVRRAVPIDDVAPLDGSTFVPRGTTALLDAMGRTINETGSRLAGMAEADRPSKVIFVVLTDGYENASQEFTCETITRMIQHQRETYNWEFVFLGANQDAIATASKMGMRSDAAMTYAANQKGTEAAWDALAEGVASYRAAPVMEASFAFDEEDRQAQRDAGAE